MKQYLIAAMRGRDKTNPNHRGPANENYEQRLEIRGGAYMQHSDNSTKGQSFTGHLPYVIGV